MPKIPNAFIQDLLSKLDIVELISSRINLRKSGNNFIANCPFHNEKTPSFTVSQSKQFFHCFGCGAHGSAIGFLMQFEHLDFIDAVERLAAYVGVSIPTVVDSENSIQLNDLYVLMEQVATFYTKELKRTSSAIEYLKSRGLNSEICKLFNIGYASSNWENLTPIYKNNNQIKQKLFTTGLLLEKNQKTYARFRERIMFPIRNRRSHIIGFGGRTIKNDPAKYLNSPETPLFHKGNELYGLYEAKQLNNTFKSILVVEGYLDVIALFQYGISNVVATLGTAISTKQIQSLLKNTNEIIFCFDGDTAGKNAAWRALESILPIMHDGISAKFLFLPNQFDPDSLIRKEGKEQFIKRVANALPLSEQLFNNLTAKINIETLDGKSHFAKEINTLLQKMPNGVFKQLLLEKLARKLAINLGNLETLLAKPNNLNVSNVANNKNPTHVQKAINILIYNPHLVEHIGNLEFLSKIELTDIDLFIQIINFLHEQPNLTIGAILESKRDDNVFLERLKPFITEEPIIPRECLKTEFIGTINRLYQTHNEHIIEKLLKKAASSQLDAKEKLKLQTLIAAAKSIETVN